MRVAIVVALLASSAAARHGSQVNVPSDLSKRTLDPAIVGYSFEPDTLADYLDTDLTKNLFTAIKERAGISPPLRIGGNVADWTHYDANINASAVYYPNRTNSESVTISDGFFKPWLTYFPNDTEFIYTLNFANTSNNFKNAVLESEAAIRVLGSRLNQFEIGNEVDHYVSSGYRDAPYWNSSNYVSDWFLVANLVTNTSEWKNAASTPKFQAGVIADPPAVPDQQVDDDDLDIVNITKKGLVDNSLIAKYAVHLYPQSKCDAVRRARLSLNLLSNHNVLWTNVSQYIPEVAAAEAVGSHLVFGETNSVSCSGKSGVSDVFATALWAVDYTLMSASLGLERVYFHASTQGQYSAFVPKNYTASGETLRPGIRSTFYSNWFIADVVAGGKNLTVAALPGANSSDFSGYSIYDAETSNLEKLVFIDMDVWNSTVGVSNPSTFSADDSTYFSTYPRPLSYMKINTPWTKDTKIRIIRLNGPGSNAKSLINVSGVVFDDATGKKLTNEVDEFVYVTGDGAVRFLIEAAEAVLLERVD